MLPLGGEVFPKAGAELEDALRAGLAIFRAPELRVKVRGEWPALDEIALDLSGGHAPGKPMASGVAGDGVKISARELSLLAKPLHYENAAVEIEIRVRDAQLEFQGGAQNSLAITAAESGEVRVKMARAELERLIQTLAGRAAAEHGVTIERTNLRVNSAGPRAADFMGEVIAQKLFMKTVVRVLGRLEIDERLNARLSNLRCEGSGMIGGLACGFLKPHIARFENRTMALAEFALGDLRVLDVALSADEPLCVHAKIGAATS